MQFIFSTTLLLYKLDTLLLKRKNLPVLDIMSFFFRIRTQVPALVRKKKPVIAYAGHFFCFNSTVSYTYNVYGVNKFPMERERERERERSLQEVRYIAMLDD